MLYDCKKIFFLLSLEVELVINKVCNFSKENSLDDFVVKIIIEIELYKGQYILRLIFCVMELLYFEKIINSKFIPYNALFSILVYMYCDSLANSKLTVLM